MRKIPDHFKIGASLSAYQAEGNCHEDGRKDCYWDEYLRLHGTFSPEPASNFYHLYKNDLALCEKFKISYLRISLSWSRIIPEGVGMVNEKGIAYYHSLIDECRNRDIEPLVSLHHFDTPLPLYKKGDWLSLSMLDAFVEYARICFIHYGDKVKKWVTINESFSLAAGQYIVGHFPPNLKYDLGKAIQAMHNMMVAHARVVLLYKDMNLKGEIGIIHILEPKFPITQSVENIHAAKFEHTLCNRFLLDATIYGGYKKDTLDIINKINSVYHSKLQIQENDLEYLRKASLELDFLGVNYYQSHFVCAYEGDSQIIHNGTGDKGSGMFALKGIGMHVKNPEVPTTDWDWTIYPRGLYEILMELHCEYGFKKEILVTENGIGIKEVQGASCIEDNDRIDYIKKHLHAVLDAYEEGVNVRGYYLWSLYDVLSWTNGYTKRYGLFFVDFETQVRTAKKSAFWYQQMIETKTLEDL